MLKFSSIIEIPVRLQDFFHFQTVIFSVSLELKLFRYQSEPKICPEVWQLKVILIKRSSRNCVFELFVLYRNSKYHIADLRSGAFVSHSDAIHSGSVFQGKIKKKLVSSIVERNFCVKYLRKVVALAILLNEP